MYAYTYVSKRDLCITRASFLSAVLEVSTKYVQISKSTICSFQGNTYSTAALSNPMVQ